MRLFQLCAPGALSPLAGEARDAMQLQLSNACDLLDLWAVDCDQMAGIKCPEYLGMFRHTSFELFAALRFAFHLKSGASNFRAALVQALSAIAPPSMRHTLVHSIEDEAARNPPGAATVRRQELAMDVALMLEMRSNFSASPVHRFVWSDASPVGEFDWLWSQYREVPRSGLVATCRALHALSGMVRTFASAECALDEDWEPPLDPLPTWLPHWQTIKQHIHEHTSPPTALASGQRSLAHTCRALLHQWFLEIPEGTSVSSFTDSIGCMCSDLGVESGNPRFRLRRF